MKKTRTGYEVLQARVAEMSSDPNALDIKIDDSKVAGILERDKNPCFVTIQVAREGVSGNGRHYSKEVIASIAEQINSNHPIGGAGHINPEDEDHAFPATETVWLGAKVVEMDGKDVVYAKGYVLPSATERRSYLELAKDLGKNVAVSIWGKAKEAIYDAKTKAYDIRGLNLQRVDWVPPGKEGIPNDGTLILASEMKSSKTNQGDPAMDKEKALKEATISEMKQHNPDLVEKIQGEATTVAEMAAVRKTLGIKDDADAAATISEMKKKLTAQEMDTELRDRVKAPAARPAVKQMVIGEMSKTENAGKTVSEMVQAVLQGDDAKAIIKAASGAAPQVGPKNDDRNQKTDRKFTKIIK